MILFVTVYNHNMTEFLKNTLFPILDRGAVLVFPTEESARAAAVEYVLDRKKAS